MRATPKQEQVSKAEAASSQQDEAADAEQEQLETETIHRTVRADIARTWWPTNP